jgi:hypothetical protein
MQPHDRITILRNRYRAAELRTFRDLVETYFARSERDADGVPMDWEGARAARSRINQMLPRILQVVRAAGLGRSVGTEATTDPGLAVGRVEVLQQIFSVSYADGLDQEILDVLDMALGAYEGGRFMALARTVNPLHYASAALAFLARTPRRALVALGLSRRRPASQLAPVDPANLESVAARLAALEELIDSRLIAAQDRQAVRHADYGRQLAELAERLDFAERVLARERPLSRLEGPAKSDVPTPR